MHTLCVSNSTYLLLNHSKQNIKNRMTCLWHMMSLNIFLNTKQHSRWLALRLITLKYAENRIKRFNQKVVKIWMCAGGKKRNPVDWTDAEFCRRNTYSFQITVCQPANLILTLITILQKRSTCWGSDSVHHIADPVQRRKIFFVFFLFLNIPLQIQFAGNP